MDVRKITLQEIVVSGSYCYTMQEFRDVVEALADGRLGPLDWVEERPSSRAQLPSPTWMRAASPRRS
ncbi:hypothetical protein ACRBEV_20405 [Methylobacterium phyllosphaerae]